MSKQPQSPITVSRHPFPHSQMSSNSWDALATKKKVHKSECLIHPFLQSKLNPLSLWRHPGLERFPSAQHLVWPLSSVVSAVTSAGKKTKDRSVTNCVFRGEIWCKFLIQPPPPRLLKSVNGYHRLLSIKQRMSFLSRSTWPSVSSNISKYSNA